MLEPLDELKQSTRQMTITVAESTTPRPAIEGRVVYERLRGRQWEVIARDVDETAVERLRFAEGVVAVESRMPSLEEIFVAYVGRDGNAPLAGIVEEATY